MNKRALALGYFFLLLVSGSCEQHEPAAAPQQVYDYALSVEEANPMHGAEVRISVQTGLAKEAPLAPAERYPAPAYLVVYSSFQRVAKRKKAARPAAERVPRDTLVMALTRTQTDTIYRLARQVFQLTRQPPLRDPTAVPPPVTHDLDNYLIIELRPYPFAGPTFQCTGYKEANAASYALHDYLRQLKAKPLHN